MIYAATFHKRWEKRKKNEKEKHWAEKTEPIRLRLIRRLASARMCPAPLQALLSELSFRQEPSSVLRTSHIAAFILAHLTPTNSSSVSGVYVVVQLCVNRVIEKRTQEQPGVWEKEGIIIMEICCASSILYTPTTTATDALPTTTTPQSFISCRYRYHLRSLIVRQ